MDQHGHKQSQLRGTQEVGPVPESIAEGAQRGYPSQFDVIAAAGRLSNSANQDSGCAPEKPPDPEQELLKELNEFKIGLEDWRIGAFDFSRELARATQWVLWLWEDGLTPRDWHGQPIDFPKILHVTFDPRPLNQFGSYTFGRSPGQGLRFTVNLNPLPIIRWKRSPALTAAALLHEMFHLAEDLYRESSGKKRRGSGSYHLREFRLRAQAVGLPVSKDGKELGVVKNSPFDLFIKRRGIPTEYEYTLADEITAPARLPKRLTWRCSCEHGVGVLVPRGSVIHATCEICFGRFTPDTLAESMRPPKVTRKVVGK